MTLPHTVLFLRGLSFQQIENSAKGINQPEIWSDMLDKESKTLFWGTIVETKHNEHEHKLNLSLSFSLIWEWIHLHALPSKSLQKYTVLSHSDPLIKFLYIININGGNKHISLQMALIRFPPTGASLLLSSVSGQGILLHVWQRAQCTQESPFKGQGWIKWKILDQMSAYEQLQWTSMSNSKWRALDCVRGWSQKKKIVLLAQMVLVTESSQELSKESAWLLFLDNSHSKNVRLTSGERDTDTLAEEFPQECWEIVNIWTGKEIRLKARYGVKVMTPACWFTHVIKVNRA